MHGGAVISDKDRIASDTMLAEKIDQAKDRISQVQGSIDGLKWFVASITTIVSIISVAHSLGWL